MTCLHLLFDDFGPGGGPVDSSPVGHLCRRDRHRGLVLQRMVPRDGGMVSGRCRVAAGQRCGRRNRLAAAGPARCRRRRRIPDYVGFTGAQQFGSRFRHWCRYRS